MRMGRGRRGVVRLAGWILPTAHTIVCPDRFEKVDLCFMFAFLGCVCNVMRGVEA